MTYIKSIEKTEYKDFKKPEEKELVIIPKKSFLKWYEYTKNIVEDIEIKKQENNKDFQECPNCRSIMESHHIKSCCREELWHLCPKCNLSFSQRQHEYFTMMMLRLLNFK